MSAATSATVRPSSRRRLATQRRRLFFLLGEGEDISPWKLTIYQFAGRYLEFTTALATGDRSGEERVVKSLIKGMNRTLTGMMTEDGDRLRLARSIGRLEGAVGRITLSQQPSYKGGGAEKVLIEKHATTGPADDAGRRAFREAEDEDVLPQGVRSRARLPSSNT